MTPAEARQVIQVLAKGVDPTTGKVLPDDSPVNDPDVIRALILAADALELLAKKPSRAREDSSDNRGKPWTRAEDQQLADAFEAGKPVAEIALVHQRTRVAIAARLVRIGRIQNRAQVLDSE